MHRVVLSQEQDRDREALLCEHVAHRAERFRIVAPEPSLELVAEGFLDLTQGELFGTGLTLLLFAALSDYTPTCRFAAS